jgi:hypothetical protein
MVTFKVSFPVKPERTYEVLGCLAQRAVVASLFDLRLAAGAPAPGRVEITLAWEENKSPVYAGLKFVKGFWLLMSQLSITGRVTLMEGTVQAWMTPVPELAKASELSANGRTQESLNSLPTYGGENR